VNGRFFETAHGPHSVVAASSFLHFIKFSFNQDITPVLAEQQALGFNEGRVFLGISGGLGTFDPRPYMDRLPEFCELMAEYGQRIEFTFGDWKRWCPNLDEQRAVLQGVASQILPYAAWARIEGMNEGDHLDNLAAGIVNEQLDPNILWCLGSRIQDAGTMVPIKSYGTYHPSRSKDWPRKVGHNCMEVADKHNVPAISNECKRPDEDGYHASNFFDAAGNAALLCAGATFHYTSGKTSTLMTDQERECAVAWVAGANAVPLDFQRGKYTAGHLHDSPVEYRPGMWSHARLLGNRACLSVPQNPTGWKVKNGWRVMSQQGSIILLER
jgi:hypothetical protein